MEQQEGEKQPAEQQWLEYLKHRLRLLLNTVTRHHHISVAGLALMVFYIVGRKKSTRAEYANAQETPLSLLWNSKVDKAFMSTSAVLFLVEGIWRRSTLPTDLRSSVWQHLTASCSHVAALPEPLLHRLATPLLAALPFVYLILVYRLFSQQFGTDFVNHSTRNSTLSTFDDFAGMEDTLLEVKEVVQFLLNRPERGQAIRALLLEGPPGTGKTLLARAMAASVDDFVACSASEFVQVYVGRGAARVRGVFNKARRSCRSPWESWWGSSRRQRTTILFIDELDALAKTRGSGDYCNDEREQTLNQLLTELDGFYSEASNVQLVVVAATNRVDTLDPAVLRRFERQVHVGPPVSVASRLAILQLHASRQSLNETHLNWKAVAENTQGFVGADLKLLVNEASLISERDNGMVSQEHLQIATARVRKMFENRQRKDIPWSTLASFQTLA